MEMVSALGMLEMLLKTHIQLVVDAEA